MKKGVLLLIFAMIFTMIVPVQASEIPHEQLIDFPTDNDGFNGKYDVSVKIKDTWNKIGSLYFGKNQIKQTIDVGSYMSCGSLTIRLTQNGGGAAFLDAVLLDGALALKANSDDEKLLKKLSKEDLDIVPVGADGVVLEFAEAKKGILTVVGRIENKVISKEPLQFPVENNYKAKNEIEDFYSYKLGSNLGTLSSDGILDEVSDMVPFVKEYRIPDSGHPAGDIYFWVMNDNKNLYVTMDTTPDNTLDIDKDYAKVYVKTDDKIKEFKVSSSDTTWGKSSFTYTDKVSYEHKVYEFVIPLSEINVMSDEEINIAFAAYGTMSLDYNCDSPALAYDSYNEVYLSVFEHFYSYGNVNYQSIVGEFVDKNGNPINYKFIIQSQEIKNNEVGGNLSNPCIVFNSDSNKFFVTWIEQHSNTDYLCAKFIGYNNYENTVPFIVSTDDQLYRKIETQDISYDSEKNEFLAVWSESNTGDAISIYGCFIGGDGSKKGTGFNISTTDEVYKINPSVVYSKSQEAHLVAWQNGDNIVACGVKSPENQHVSNIWIIGEGEYPDVSYNNSSQRIFITWQNNGILYGRYYDLNSNAGTYFLDPKPVSDLLSISSQHDGNQVAYPSAYYSGFSSDMLCVWSMFKPESECFAELCYIDIYAKPEGSPFLTDTDIENCDNIDVYNLPIAISGDNENQNLIAYILDANNDVGYRIIGYKPQEQTQKSCINPDIAYDTENELYLSVFEYRELNLDGEMLSSHIYGEIVDKDGYVISSKIPIFNSSEDKFNYEPTIAYDKANNNFLVVWSSTNNEYQNSLMAVKVAISENNEEIEVNVDNPFLISGNESNEFDLNEEQPDLAYGTNGEFLLAWRQTTQETFEIYGRIVDSDNNLNNDNFLISHSPYNHINPSVCYNPAADAFLAAWSYWSNEAEVIGAQSIDASGALTDKGAVNIGGNSCNFPNVSLDNINNRFFVTWHEYGNRSMIKGQYISLDTELVPLKAANELNISPNDTYHGIYPAAYGDGETKMLCAWSSTLFEDNIYNPRLQYIDWEGNKVGNAFYPDEYSDFYTTDNLTASTQIAMNGNDNGNVIIAYYYEPKTMNYFHKSNYVDEYVLDIGYKVFGKTEVEIEPYIEFSNTPYDEIVVGDTIQTTVKLYDNEFPNGHEITEDLYYFSENSQIAAIDNSGLIKGISEGETSITAIYDPWAQVDSDDIKFSDGKLSVKNPATVKVKNKLMPTLTFDKESYNVQINKNTSFSVKLKNYEGVGEQDVTGTVIYELGNPEIASISTSGAITGLAVGTTTVSAIMADSEIEPAVALITVSPVTSVTSKPAESPIGQILVDNKIIKNIYKSDVIAKDNIYTFTADKSGKNAKLWLNSNFYGDLADDYPGKIVKFKWNSGSYSLPLNCKEVLKEIDNSAEKVSIIIENVNDSKIIEAAQKSAENMGSEIISDLIDFSVIVEKNRENKEIHSLDFYAERTINKPDKTDKDISTAMKFIENKEYLTFAPSVFDNLACTIKYRGNGIFTVVKNYRTFNDISNHWARKNIERLATRNIAFGRENNNFTPDDFITRAEFAVMITRALGITEEEGSDGFSDVSAEWYAEDIKTAFKSNLISGKNDGKFHPNEKIQRKDMAVIIDNALKFAGMSFNVPDIDYVLAKFNDNKFIAGYARNSIAVCAETGIIKGRDTNNFDPDDFATRAEASAIIERMLAYLKFID